MRPGLWQRLWTALFGTSYQARWADATRRRRALAEARRAATEGEYWARGRAGEEHLANVLAHQLDERFLLLRNYTPPWPHVKGGDIVAVLLGPHGLTVFEVKAWKGNFRYAGGDWWYQSSPQSIWEPARRNPSQQAKANAQRVRAVLDRFGLNNIRVQPVVAVAHPDMHVDLEPPVDVYVFFATDAMPRVRELVNSRSNQVWMPPQALWSVYQSLLR